MPKKTQSKIHRVKWKDFLRKSIGAAKVAEYCYCPAKISNMKILGEIQTPIMIEGAELHEEQAQELLSEIQVKKVKAPKTLLEALAFVHAQVRDANTNRYNLVNGEETIMYYSILPELGCIGVPDLIDCTTGTPIVVEKKFVGRIPSRIWPDHELQLAIYMLSLERLGFKSVRGRLEYHHRESDKTTRIELKLDPQLRKKAKDTVKAVRGIIEKNDEPVPTTNPNQCRACAYVDKCKWRAVGV